MAGFTIAGTPASSAGASFSSMPHTGKLKALMCTAAPDSGTQMCWPTKLPPLERASTPPSRKMRLLGSSRVPLLAYTNSVLIPPSMSIHASPLVAPVA